MKPVLLALPGPTWPVVALLFVVAIIAVGLWLVLVRRRGGLTREHTLTAGIVLALVAVALLILRGMPEIQIKAYGAMLTVGFVFGTLSAVRLGRRRGIPAERLLDLGLWILVGAIFGARIMYVLITPNPGPLFDVSRIMAEGLGGLSFHGGLLGGLLTGSAFILLSRLPYWRVTDCLAPGIALGYAITRIGCFLNGCCFGKHTDLPWAVTFPQIGHPVHPTQLYASLIGFAMFGILLWLARGNSLGRAGRLFMVFLVLEGIERFTMEIYRQPDPNFTGTLTPAQFVSVALVILGLIGWFVLPKRPAVLPDEHVPSTPLAPPPPPAKMEK
jgi:phosphatidylglycerol:prolipoprotein diacylglycerol transferase